MNVSINGEMKQVPDGMTLDELVEYLSLPPRRMAIELNKHVIRKQDWENTKLDERDTIEIVHFVGGG
jgi:sulfur carrier protein